MVVTSASISRSDYVPVLDGLRAVSILLVVLSHLGAHLGLDHVVPGAFGVTLFFFISGFLITRQLVGGLAAHGRIDFARFYGRRALRLMPAAAVYVAVAGVVYGTAGGRIAPAGWLAALFYGANYYDLWVGYRSALAGVRHPFNILWSLAIEEHFYLLWPACLALAWRGRWALGGVLALCVAVLAWRWWLWGHCFIAGAPWVCGPENPNPLWRFNRLYMGTDTRLDSLAWGAVLALALAARKAGWNEAIPPRPPSIILGLVCNNDGGSGGDGTSPPAFPWLLSLALLLLALSFALPGPCARFVLRPSLQGLALLGVFPWLLSGDSVVHRVLRAGPALLMGRLSYSIYLWHWGALGVADRVARPGSVAWLAVAVPLLVGLSMASYWGIERPMLGVRRRFGSGAVG